MTIKSHFCTLVVNVEVSGAVLVMVSDLQPVRMADLVWLKCHIQVLDGDDSFRAF